MKHAHTTKTTTTRKKTTDDDVGTQIIMFVLIGVLALVIVIGVLVKSSKMFVNCIPMMILQKDNL
jgi:hypothetical protein